jgi:uncharacterized protein (DUF305 family)
MSSTTIRRLALPAVALSAALTLAACGNEGASDTATTGSSQSEHGGGHSTDSAAQANEVDIRFLTGMTPHHEQAVEMSDIVLAADPPAEVAAIAREIKAAQAPEIEQMEQMLEALGEEAAGGGHGGGHSGGHSGGHGGMMSEQDMADLRAARGTEAARLYLEGMIAHHRGAVVASEEQIAEGEYAPAIALAKQIKATQEAEIAEMQALLEDL